MHDDGNVFVMIGMAVLLDSFDYDCLIEVLKTVETDIENDTQTIEQYFKMIDIMIAEDCVASDLLIIQGKLKDLFAQLRHNILMRENIMWRL
jgi:hypothetical protein